MSVSFDPQNINLTALGSEALREITCWVKSNENEDEDKNERLNVKIAAIFTIAAVSTAVTMLPIWLKRWQSSKLGAVFYNFARCFGSGIILATAIIHLLIPAFQEIGPDSCVGMTGEWKEYLWLGAILLTSIVCLFLVQFSVERKYGVTHSLSMPEVPTTPPAADEVETMPLYNIRRSLQIIHRSYPLPITSLSEPALTNHNNDDKTTTPSLEALPKHDLVSRPSYKEQIATFQVLEAGVLFHSGIIGLNLGTSSSTQLKPLFIVLVFHQAFEGLGLGARLSAISFPTGKAWTKWVLCAFYGLVTPIAIGVGITVRQLYDPASQTAQIVSGVLDTVSAGILLYTGLVELLAREFLFNEEVRGMRGGEVSWMVGWVLAGATVMASLGRWA